ncbi:hypothetical protein IQ13_3208 [Lacibacter cauensis]|uniref:Uncharacterized protein n=1 Tax=Lacibacter cauensis TaxID=510947 RepID=A0A562SIG1_9BACT|nr:hypothetical protein [Lacibacter cauensis]TWI80530.1 hypothetical protein IQ13_3208 [Lacibacter cauensis]
MKSLKTILTFSVFSLLIAAVCVYFGAGVEASLIAGVAVNLAGSLIPQQNGVLGMYVGSGTGTEGQALVQALVTDPERAAYLVNSTSPRFKGKKVVPGYLRLEAPIKNTEPVIRFRTFLGDGATVKSTERRLDRNDAFIATGVRIGLLKQDTANAKTNGLVHTYPNITAFGAAAAADLLAIYQGALRMNIDDKDELKGFPMSRFLHIPETQQTAGTNYDQRSPEAGIVNLTPHIIIDGDKKNEIEVVFPTYAAFAGGTSATAGFEHFLVMELFGFEVLQGSKGA